MSPGDRRRRYEEMVRNCSVEQVTAIEGGAQLKTEKELRARILYHEWQLDEAYAVLTKHSSGVALDYDAVLQSQHS